MEPNIIKKEIITSKKGLPCVWEAGGSYTSSGYSVIVAGPGGERKKPICVRRKGDLCNGQHALIPVERGDFYVYASQTRGEYTIHVYRIVALEGSPQIRPGRLIEENLSWQELAERYGGGSLEKALGGGKVKYDSYTYYLVPSQNQNILAQGYGCASLYEAEPYTMYTAVLRQEYSFEEGQWNIEPPAFLHEAVRAAKRKAAAYHCRTPYFVATTAYNKVIEKFENADFGELEDIDCEEIKCTPEQSERVKKKSYADRELSCR